MWSEDEIIAFLKTNLTEKRFKHVIGVRNTAVKLAQVHGEDEKKAAYAALIHDCAKNMDKDKLKKIIEDAGMVLDEVECYAPQLLHSKAGAVIAKDKMGISDKDILNSVIYHTTGRANMSRLEKIIYLADYIEPSRDFLGVDKVRSSAFVDLDGTLLLSIDNSIKYILDKGQLLHIDTIRARNWLILNK
ncbi:bis(5'-nucleosyl)-tetraphosphatase (symmetrical) YqeK [Clostridium oryzae]|uniref:bis(5'-nucleosyl)-tetraphosphatase (symmetrical) n=1 Tax=Clostridium oryzae TaxID=1450648 RepID=A0A1V4IV42_9CLOT|nr:bis(5'-nucleosyl)-tetraphosphatase (symmetrical) YqeK [Clostridium oryzae]OPJ63773.1 putative nicotinate-nucleotide adenylyltransferase [Clostridium oryzae]